MSRGHRTGLRGAWLILAILVPGVRAADPPAVYDYEVLERRAQPRDHFLQGLEIRGDLLYVGTGLYGQSRLLEYDYPSLQLRRSRPLPATLFGEGVSRLGERIYQLTWRAGRVLVYDAATLEVVDERDLPTEGWGLTNNGRQLIASDGSARLYFLDPVTLERRRSLGVTLLGKPQPRLNELEWIEGEIWANVWGSDFLLRIDPDSGAVRAVVDLRGLLDATDRRAGTDVLNGIAWDARRRQLWVTGKRWPWLFRLALQRRGD